MRPKSCSTDIAAANVLVLGIQSRREDDAGFRAAPWSLSRASWEARPYPTNVAAAAGQKRKSVRRAANLYLDNLMPRMKQAEPRYSHGRATPSIGGGRMPAPAWGRSAGFFFFFFLFFFFCFFSATWSFEITNKLY